MKREQKLPLMEEKEFSIMVLFIHFLLIGIVLFDLLYGLIWNLESFDLFL